MKHIVNLVLSQPDHDFVSMRTRRHEKTYMLEARNSDEAILRATRKFKELGFYVHGASIVEQKAPEVPAVKQSLSEGVGGVLAAQVKQKVAQNKARAEVDKSEVEDKAGKAQAGSALAAYLKNKAATMKEEVEVTSQYLEEKLTAADPASKWIHDFVHSDNPKFEGKSKKERINMALGAKYAADRAVKEEVKINEAKSAEDWHDKIDNADTAEDMKNVISKVPTKHLQYLYHWNMGLSGARQHPARSHIKAELNSRNALLSSAESEKRFDEEVELEEGRAMEYKMSRSTIAGDRGNSRGGEITVPQKDREEIARILGAKDDKKQDKKLEENAELEEAVSRKDFKQVAGIIKEIPDAAKRKEIAQHHAEIFANQNPRFDRSRFYAAAGVNLREEDELEEGVRNNPNLTRVHTKWFVKPPKGSRTFGKEFRMADKDKAEAHAMDIGGSVHKMDQYGSTMKEEVEQIDELNKETLASYIGKAAQSVGTKERVAKGIAVNAAMTTSKKRRDMYLKSAETWRNAAARRVAGIKTAAEKLTKEEVEQVEEAKADPVAKAKELLDQAEKGTYKGSAAKLQKALEKAKSKNFDQGKGYKLEEDAEQLDETGVVKKTNKTLKNLMAASKGAKVNAAMGAAKMDPADYGYNKAQHLNKAIGRMVSRGAEFVEEGTEGTAPTTPKEKELAAKAGDPNKITKKDVLAARGVKLDEVKGSYKDIATEKAEDERLAKKEAKDSKSAKAAETVINLAKSKKNKINTEPKVDLPGHGIGGGGTG